MNQAKVDLIEDINQIALLHAKKLLSKNHTQLHDALVARLEEPEV